MAAKNVETDVLKELSEINERLDAVTTCLDVAINLLLDIVLANESLAEPRGVTEKLDWLDASRRFVLRPSEAARILGRRAGDISSRRAEIAEAKKKGRSLRKKVSKSKAKTQSSAPIESDRDRETASEGD